MQSYWFYKKFFHSTLNHHFSFILSGNNAVCYIKRKYYSLKNILDQDESFLILFLNYKYNFLMYQTGD